MSPHPAGHLRTLRWDNGRWHQGLGQKILLNVIGRVLFSRAISHPIFKFENPIILGCWTLPWYELNHEDLGVRITGQMLPLFKWTTCPIVTNDRDALTLVHMKYLISMDYWEAENLDSNASRFHFEHELLWVFLVHFLHSIHYKGL